MTDHETTLRKVADLFAYRATLNDSPLLRSEHAACLAGAEALRREGTPSAAHLARQSD
jgi:hypothetical protein